MRRSLFYLVALGFLEWACAAQTAPEIGFEPNTWSVIEGEEAKILLTRSGATNVEASVLFAMRSRSVFSQQRIGLTNRVVFAPGETNQIVTIPTIDIAGPNRDESFDIILREPSNATLRSMYGSLLVLDDDFATTLLVSFQIVNERQGFVPVRIYRLGGTSTPLEVTLETLPGTAQPGVDFEPIHTNLTIYLSETTVEIPLINNTNRDGVRRFSIRLVNPSAGTLTNAESAVVIHDDDNFGDPGTLDLTFPVGRLFNNHVYDLHVQPDGKIVAAGIFDFPNDNLARLNPDGTVDYTFGPSVNGSVQRLHPQNDGSFIISGAFPGGIAKILADGARDTNFAASIPFGLLSTDAQDDGKLIAGGYFTSANGESVQRLVRFNPDGSIDRAFQAGTNVIGWPSAVKVQPDGKILVAGGSFAEGTVSRQNFYRLNSDGTLDQGFEALSPGTAISAEIDFFPDGSILLGARGGAWNRYFTNGVVDTTFGFLARSADVLPDGRMLISGNDNRTRLAAMDGTILPGFEFVADYPTIDSLATGPEGTIYIGGGFEVLSGIASANLARLFLDDRSQPATVEWNGSRFGAIEESGRAALTLIRRGNTNETLTVNAETVGNSAVPGVDFVSTNLTIQVLPGETWKVVEFPLINDPEPEADETVLVGLRGPSIGTNQTATARIISEEGFIEFGSSDMTVDELAGTISFEIRKVGAAPYAITGYRLIPSGSASPSQDYFSGSIGISLSAWAGAAEMPRTLQVYDDAQVESEEAIILELSPPAAPHALGANSVLRILIRDNEGPYGPGEGLDAPPRAFPGPGGTLLLQGSFRSGHGANRPGIAWLDPFGRLATNTLPALPENSRVVTGDAHGWWTAQTTSSGFPSSQSQSRFQRLLPDGSLDPRLSTNNGIRAVHSTVQTRDNQLLVIEYSAYGYAFHLIDTNAALARSFTNRIYRRASTVPLPQAVAADLQSSGKLVVGGNIFAEAQPDPSRAREYNAFTLNLARLETNNTIDSAFLPLVRGPLESAPITHLKVLPDDSILIAGGFTNVNLTPRQGLALLSPEGALVAEFNPDWTLLGTNSLTIQELQVTPDGKILVVAAEGSGSRLLRLDQHGKLDPTFRADIISDKPIHSLVQLPDERLAITGDFLRVANEPRARLAYLTASGELLGAHPVLLEDIGVEPSGVILRISVRAPSKVTVQVSTDLLEWRTADSVQLPAGSSTISVPTDDQKTFIRAQAEISLTN